MKKHLIFSMMFLLTILGGPFMTQGLMVGTNNQSSNNNAMNILEPSVNKVRSDTQSTQTYVGNANTAENTIRLQTSSTSSSQTAPSYNFSQYGTTVSVNATSYKPGQTASVNVTSSNVGINGSISWTLLSPLNEPFFGFSSDTTYSIFQDPNLVSGINDWINDPSQPFQTFTVSNYSSTMKLLTLGSTITNASVPYKALLDRYITPGIYQITFLYNTSNSVAGLQLNAWNGTSYRNYPITAHASTLISTSISQLTIGSPSGSSNYLGSQIYFSNTINNTWNLGGFRMFHNLPKVQLYRPGNNTAVTNTTTESFRSQNSDYNNTITIQSVAYQDLVNKINPHNYANFTILLPKYSLFLGDWQFALTVYPNNNAENPLASNITYKIPITITDQVVFKQNLIYMNRGFNSTTGLPIYVNETNDVSVYSPGDNITLLGSLAYASTNKISFNSQYYGQIATNGYMLSNASQSNLKNFIWGNTTSITPSSVKIFNNNGKTVADGNFTTLVPNVNTTWGVDYGIPMRGIYGNVSNTLYLTFPNLLQFDTTSTPNAGKPFVANINMSQIVVKFRTNITSEVLPFNRVYYLTELLQGSFNVTTTIYNTSLATIYPKNNISTIINIPRSDLTFNVFLAENSGQQAVLNFTLSLYQDTFIYNQIISPNLDIRNNYALHINWEDALLFGDINQGQMRFVVNNATEYPVSIEGTFNIDLPTTIPQVKQGTNLVVGFNISIAQLQTPAKGLSLLGRICQGNNTCSLNSSSNINIVESNGLFTVYYTIPTNANVGLYTLTLYSSYGMSLGNIQFVVTPGIIPKQDIHTIPPALLVYIGSAFVLAILVIFLLVIFLKGMYIPKS